MEQEHIMPKGVSAQTLAVQDAVQAAYGPAPTNASGSLIHILRVFAKQPNDAPAIIATKGLYGKDENGKPIVTGLTHGQIRELATAVGINVADYVPGYGVAGNGDTPDPDASVTGGSES